MDLFIIFIVIIYFVLFAYRREFADSVLRLFMRDSADTLGANEMMTLREHGTQTAFWPRLRVSLGLPYPPVVPPFFLTFPPACLRCASCDGRCCSWDIVQPPFGPAAELSAPLLCDDYWFSPPPPPPPPPPPAPCSIRVLPPRADAEVGESAGSGRGGDADGKSRGDSGCGGTEVGKSSENDILSCTGRCGKCRSPDKSEAVENERTPTYVDAAN